MDRLWNDALYPGVTAAGYEAVRIDKREHINKIDDEILAVIRKSRILVTDFTGQRGGVYYEAGFAGGLRLPVVWTCREDDLKSVHFDTRQFNFLTWTEHQLEDFRKRLTNRIEGTIGRGSFTSKSV
jgi:nucleoside 2-deoxyribosyltransferase